MTDDEKRAIQEKARRNQQQWTGGTFQHFDNDEQRESHLAYVRDTQQAGESPF